MKKDVETYRSKLQESIEKNPHNIADLIRLGILEFEYFHNHEKAIGYFEKAIDLDPNNVDARFWLAACLYYDYCEYEKAEPFLKEALQLDQNRPECLSLMASIIYGTHRPVQEAISYVQKAIHLAPDWPALRYQFAEFLLAMGKIDNAEKEVHNALSLKTIKPQKDEVDRYFERVVTGRGWDNLNEEFRPIMEQIQKAKHK